MSSSLNYLQGITINFFKKYTYNPYRIPFVKYLYIEEVSANCIATKLVAHRSWTATNSNLQLS